MVRGYSAPALIIEDEAAFVADETFDALIPMLAASPDGRIILMSTPYNSGRPFLSHFWHGGGCGLRCRRRSIRASRSSGWRRA
jgi:hypothetical protein